MGKSTETDKLRQVQMVQLELLIEFDRICKKHDIPYQLFAGTLLGSIRHKGFIPWDDDIDLAILREDYNRFLEIAPRELDDRYFLQTYETDKEYYKQSGRLRRNDTIMLQELYEPFDIHHGIPISIMPLDNIEPNSTLGKAHRVLYQLAYNNFWRLNNARAIENCRREKNKVKKTVRYGLFAFSKVIPKSLTDKLHYKVSTLFNNKDTEYVSHLTNGATKKRFHAYKIKRSDFYDMIPGKFEGYSFPIPRSYEEVLGNLYGDFMAMPPVEAQQPHHGVVKIEINVPVKEDSNNS